jgi:hypothetical protein
MSAKHTVQCLECWAAVGPHDTCYMSPETLRTAWITASQISEVGYVLNHATAWLGDGT